MRLHLHILPLGLAGFTLLVLSRQPRAGDATAPSLAPARETLPPYQQNPVRTPQPTRQMSALPIAGATLTHPALRVRTCIATAQQSCRLTAVATRDGKGQFHATAEPTPRNAPDAFAELSAFYHAARALAYCAALRQLRPATPLPQTDLYHRWHGNRLGRRTSYPKPNRRCHRWAPQWQWCVYI